MGFEKSSFAGFYNFLHPHLGQDAGENHFGIGYTAQLRLDVIGDSFHRAGGFVFHQVPFIQNDDTGLARLLNFGGQFLILLAYLQTGVQYQGDDIGAVDGAQRAHNRESFDTVVDPGLASDAGGVYQGQFAALVIKGRVHGITGGAGYIGNNCPFLTAEHIGN